MPWGVAAAVALVAGWALWGRTGPATTAPQVTHLEIGFPRDVEPCPATSTAPAISPDGRTVAMIGVKDGVRRVFVRRLDRAEATELPDTVGANGAVFSPDGGSVAVMFASGLITRIALADQQRKVLTSGADITVSITWSQAGIIFSRGGALWIVPPEGGAPRALTVLDAARHEVAHDGAVVLPGGRLVLFASQTTDPGDERIESVSIDGGPRVGGGRAGEDARVVAHWPSAFREGRRGAGGGLRPAHGDAARHGHADHAGRRDRGARLRSNGTQPVVHRDTAVLASRLHGHARGLGGP